jgi:hypothetical protein
MIPIKFELVINLQPASRMPAVEREAELAWDAARSQK